MQQLTRFQFHTHSIRVFPTDNGASFFVIAKDVSDVLGYRDARDFVRQVPEKNRGTQKVRTAFGDKDMLCINESGLYRAVLRSNKPEAEPFMDWVTEEVLPAIRRTGAYVHPAAADSTHAQLALAQEVGFLKNQLIHRDQIIVAKDQAIMGLQGDLIGSLKGENRLLKKVSRLEARISKSEAKELVILMESQGYSRAEIAARTGRTRGHIRVIVCNAKLAGRLPNQGELNLEEKQ